MISEREFRACIVELVKKAETRAPQDVRKALQRCVRIERSRVARLQLEMMLENLKLAEKKEAPICQDTGVLSFFVRVGERLDFDVARSIGAAVLEAEEKVPLRMSAVDPLSRVAISGGVWSVNIEPADEGLEVALLVKGAGTENFSKLFMFSPSNGLEKVEAQLLEVLREAGGKICPPVIVGVGIGGDASRAILLSRRALLRRLDVRNPDRRLAKLERSLTERTNLLRIGPMGLGGVCTVLGVKIETAPTHTACFPIAFSFQCWPGRRGLARLVDGRMEVIEP
ncbi:MAG: fumarate hydratase [Candidatus Hadarchaeales archaeon]